MRAALLVLCACTSAPRLPALELVETAPIETTLEHADIADAHTTWIEMIAGAKKTIDLAQFYASDQPNSRLEGVVRALEDAAKRGVHVRFLAEDSFVKTYPDTLDRLAHGGATVRHLKLPVGILHAKYFIVDGREAFLGSQNFDWRALEHNLELGVRVRDEPIVRGLQAIFEYDWSYPNKSTAVAPASALVASPKDLLPPGVAWDLPKLVALIDGAKTSIRMQMLTYLAGEWTELEAPLVRAAARGVAVELMVADWAKRKHTLPGLQQLARTKGIEIRLVTIPAWSSGFIPYARVIHAKTLVVDGARGWLGTSNWEREYFYESRNVGLLVDDAKVLADITRVFADVWRSPYATRLDPEASYEPPRISD